MKSLSLAENFGETQRALQVNGIAILLRCVSPVSIQTLVHRSHKLLLFNASMLCQLATSSQEAVSVNWAEAMRFMLVNGRPMFPKHGKKKGSALLPCELATSTDCSLKELWIGLNKSVLWPSPGWDPCQQIPGSQVTLTNIYSQQSLLWAQPGSSTNLEFLSNPPRYSWSFHMFLLN